MTEPQILRDSAAHALLVFKVGHKLLHALALPQPPVRVVKMDKAERRYLTEMQYCGKPYPLSRALRHFKRAGRTFGITDKARAVLRALKNSGPS